MNYNKFRSICRVARVFIGLGLMGVGVVSVTAEAVPVNFLWFLGAIPYLAGATNFCPTCMITKKCDLPQSN